MSGFDQVVDAIRNDRSLSKIAKRQKLKELLAPVKKERIELVAKYADLQVDKRRTERRLAGLYDLRDAWGYREENDLGSNRDIVAQVEIQVNDCSRLHKLGDALRDGEVLHPDDDTTTTEPLPPNVHTFVVAHNWAAVIEDDGGEWRLPYENCSFEYRFGGRTVIVLCQQLDDQPARGAAFYETKSGDWLTLGDWSETNWLKHVRAAAVMLDAEIAMSTVIRAPIALNTKRIRENKLPIYDYHVLDLSHRTRLSRNLTPGTGARKRLHFCRGHWRRYEQHKTWIRWCLKGDPDLGFIEKQYAL